MPDQNVNDTLTEVAVVSEAHEQQFHLGFERLETEINAVPENELEPINLDVPSTVATVLGAEPEVLPLRTALATLSTFDIKNVDQLRDRALALGHTHTLFRIANRPPDGIDELVAQAIDTRDRFHSDASALVRRGLLDGAAVDKLRGGNSHRMIAFDVIGLAALFLAHWDAISGKTALDVAEIEEARRAANRLVAAIGLREQASAERDASAILRQKAYTLLVRAYNETRQAIAFVRRREGDVDQITPSLYAGRGRRAPEPPIVVPEPTPQQSVPPEAPGAGVAAGSADVAAGVPVGFPGAAPLTNG